MIWDQLTSRQIEQLEKNIMVVLVLAATEQHGPHLPLATDRMIGEHFAYSLHEALPEQVLILPPIAIGCSDHHMDFQGTLSLNHDTFEKLVIDISDSVLRHGFRNIILLNSHGGNQGIGQVLLERLGYRYPDAHFVLASWWRLAADKLKKITESGPGGTGHAGEFETSLMMFIAPELVNKQKFSPGGNSVAFVWAEGDLLVTPKAAFYRSMKQITPNGVFGNPMNASADKGRIITEAVVESLEHIVRDLAEK